VTAIKAGADLLVVGKAVTGAADRAAAAAAVAAAVTAGAAGR
jgi:orotidine-5'-phosphate decarboxylase